MQPPLAGRFANICEQSSVKFSGVGRRKAHAKDNAPGPAPVQLVRVRAAPSRRVLECRAHAVRDGLAHC